MNQVEIKILDPVHCKVLKGTALLKPLLSYRSEYWRQGPFRKTRHASTKYLIKDNLFLTGFLPRVREHCRTSGYEFSIDFSDLERLEPGVPYVEGKDLEYGKYGFQFSLINKALKHQRGVIKAAMGSGKTILMAGIISCYPSARVLFLSNTHVPISQFEETVGKKSRITTSTIQGFYRKDPDEYATKYDIILVDECHEGMGFKGYKIVKKKRVETESMYHKVLTNSLAPIRLGFTATLPGPEENRLALEGLLGPVIGELTIQEGMERGVLAKPRIIMKEIPYNQSVRDLRTYQEVYKAGVVENRALNRQIILDTIEDIEDDRNVLILVNEIQHGENLLHMADQYDLPLTFVQGRTDKEVRDQIRRFMIDLKEQVVVATSVFRKALNVPSLGSVVNGCLSKSDVVTLQLIGRGLRAVEGKEDVIIRDYFLSSHPYLISHFGKRLSLYFKEGWLGKGE